MNWLDEMEPGMSSEADRSALNYRLDVMEQRIANLEQWLNEAANDMLNRTSTAVVLGNSNGQVVR